MALRYINRTLKWNVWNLSDVWVCRIRHKSLEKVSWIFRVMTKTRLWFRRMSNYSSYLKTNSDAVILLLPLHMCPLYVFDLYWKLSQNYANIVIDSAAMTPNFSFTLHCTHSFMAMRTEIYGIYWYHWHLLFAILSTKQIVLL